jgi:hypothetical protein
VTNCGSPRFFCDTGGWAFCDDYRDIYCPIFCNFLTKRSNLSVDSLSSTNVSYTTDGYQDPAGATFGNAQEHFHTVVEDSQFGMTMVRMHQPFDFANREGHLHFEVDLKGSHRRYVRLMLSPVVTKTLVDDRQDLARPCPALDIWFYSSRFLGNRYGGSGSNCTGTVYGNQFFPFEEYHGTDNVRDLIDVYVTRTNVRILVNGVTFVDAPVQDLGFDRAYVYLSQVSYNPCKAFQDEGFPQYECTTPAQVFHWDNVAWDGPVLARNSLTPAGMQDVVFNVYGALSCTVKGVAAPRVGPDKDYQWLTYTARMPVQAVTEDDVQCTGDFGSGFQQTDGRPRGFEVIKR